MPAKRTAPRCRGCDNRARRHDAFCCDACRNLYFRYEEKIGDRETVEMQTDETTVFVTLSPGCHRHVNLQNSA